MHDPLSLVQGIQISGDDGVLSVEFMIASGALVKAVLAFSKGAISTAVSEGRSGKEIYQEFMSSKGVTKAKWNRISVGAISPNKAQQVPLTVTSVEREWHRMAKRLAKKCAELAGEEVGLTILNFLTVYQADETSDRFVRKSKSLLSRYIGTDASARLIEKIGN